MGLASSQARMLLLTARKSDLEYRAQMISQRKINLAMQTQQLATNYTKAMSNRQMDFVHYTDGNSQEVVTEKLSYAGIMAENASGSYLVVTAQGKYVVSGRNDRELEESKINVAMKLFTAGMIPKKENGQDYTPEEIQAVKTAVTQAQVKKEENPTDQDLSGYQSLVDMYKTVYKTVPAASNADFFQSALRNGSLYLYKSDVNKVTGADGTVSSQAGYNIVSWSSLDVINDNLNTTDDAAAKAEYESKSLILSNQDKMLDLELNQIQTQHKAIETEYDSVKKVIEKNIDVSYKIFA